jgi:hypothetical protein
VKQAMYISKLLDFGRTLVRPEASALVARGRREGGLFVVLRERRGRTDRP